ncbi:MAG TPA: DUF4142 domain-containing protein [Nitrospira sp.]|nr:DUF4142 domain-containing protein [Nitrospira sp.]
MNGFREIRFAIMTAVSATVWEGCGLLQEHLPGLTMSNANLVHVLDTIDEAEIDAARLAMDKAADSEVRAFAGRILNEHRGLADANGRLARELALQPTPPALASDLKRAHIEAMHELRAKSGRHFDQVYLRYEIQRHVEAFNFLEAAAASVANATLKQQLVRAGPDLLSHISAARALERHLGFEQLDTVAAR